MKFAKYVFCFFFWCGGVKGRGGRDGLKVVIKKKKKKRVEEKRREKQRKKKKKKVGWCLLFFCDWMVMWGCGGFLG